MKARREGDAQGAATVGGATVIPLHELSDQSDDQGDDNDRDLCDPDDNDPSSVGAGVVDPLPLPSAGFECYLAVTANCHMANTQLPGVSLLAQSSWSLSDPSGPFARLFAT